MADKALEVASQISNKQITGIISYWYNGQWINIADTNQRNNMQKSIDNLSGLDKTIAALPHSYYSPAQPTGTSYNDTDRWYKTSTDSDGTIKYTPYKWDSATSSWQPMLDQSAIHTFVGSAPASPVEGDFWMDNTTLKQYQTGTWVVVPTHNNFTSQPVPPYKIGDTWTQSGATYFCTTARDSGAFTANDWTMQQLTITSLDNNIQTDLKNSVKTTGTYKGVTLNDAGLTATAGSTTVAMNSTDGFLIKNTSGQVFHVDTVGNLTMQGDITAGNISGVNFAGNNLTLAGILAVTGAISNQFSYTDENQIQNVGETVISNGGMKSVANRTLPSSASSDDEDSFLHVISYEFSPQGYRSFGYKNQDDYTQNNPETVTLYDDDGSYLTSGTELESAYHLGGFSGNSLNDDSTVSNKALVQFSDMLQYASSEAQHSGSASFKDWFDIVAGIQSHPNLLLNSTFINGQTSWSGFNAQNYMTNVTHDGNFAVCIESAGGTNFISQDLSHIPDPGHKICLSFWANINKTDGGFNGGVLITFQGINANYTATLGDSNPTYEAGWHYYAFNPITVPNGTTGIRFSFYNNEHTGNKVYYAQPMLNDGDHAWPYMPTY